MVILDARGERHHHQLRERQGLTYSLAHLLAVAIHNPRRMPAFDRAFPDPRKPVRHQSAEEMLQAMRAWSDVIETATRH